MQPELPSGLPPIDITPFYQIPPLLNHRGSIVGSEESYPYSDYSLSTDTDTTEMCTSDESACTEEQFSTDGRSDSFVRDVNYEQLGREVGE